MTSFVPKKRRQHIPTRNDHLSFHQIGCSSSKLKRFLSILVLSAYSSFALFFAWPAWDAREAASSSSLESIFNFPYQLIDTDAMSLRTAGSSTAMSSKVDRCSSSFCKAVSIFCVNWLHCEMKAWSYTMSFQGWGWSLQNSCRGSMFTLRFMSPLWK
ncbi:hypothetical protein EDD21DRAFT_387412 [Dissophora ornata]|nr:hypothetical protein EDD21DRAFT_387412 [Dissophora ornata]